jgi:hypothetical protein
MGRNIGGKDGRWKKKKIREGKNYGIEKEKIFCIINCEIFG